MKNGHLMSGIAALVVAGLAGGAQADVVTITAKRDTTIFRSTDGLALASGAGPSLYTGATAFHIDLLQRALLRFDTVDIPAGATVTSATLVLTMTRALSTSGTQPGSVHRLTASWGEGASVSFGGQGAAAEEGDASWSQRFEPGVAWASAGGDFVAAPIATFTTDVSQAGTAISITSAAMAADVQAWLADRSGNFGWIIRGGEDFRGSAREFASRENPDTGIVPRLVVEFTAANPADFNGDGVVDPDDLADYIACFFALPACPQADFSGDGAVDPDDLADFIAAFFG